MKPKFWKQMVEYIKHTNTNQNKSGVVVSILDKREFW